MIQIRISKAEFDQFRELQHSSKRKPKGCIAAFSTNPAEETWSFVTWGLTPAEFRSEVRSRSPKLDEIFGIFIELPDKYPKGGRFFIDWDGVYWKGINSERYQFVKWVPEEPLRTPISQLTYSELKAMSAVKRAEKALDGKSTNS